MTAPRTETVDRPDDPSAGARRSQLSPVQIAASALAAVSSAVVASFFGVAGTLIGAALASVISTVSAALYSNSLRRTSERLRKVTTQLNATGARPRAGEPSTRTPRTLPAGLDPRRPASRRSPRWTWVAVSTAAVFLVAMGIVTGIELIGQRPVSALVGASHSTDRTTLGALTDGSTSSPTSPSAPSTAPTSAPATTTADSSPSAGASPTPSRTSASATTATTSSSSSSSASASPTRAQPTPSTVSPTATP